MEARGSSCPGREAGAGESARGAHGGACVAVCAVTAGGAQRVHAACDSVVLCMQGQQVCRQESVGAHGCWCGCARRVSGARRV